MTSLENLARTGASAVHVPITWYMDNISATTINRIDAPSPLATSTDDDIIAAIVAVKKFGMKLVLSPTVDLNWDVTSNGRDYRNPNYVSRAMIGRDFDDNAWSAWLASYEQFLLHYAMLCAQQDVDVLNVASGLETAFMAQEQRWRDLINKTRTVRCPLHNMQLQTCGS